MPSRVRDMDLGELRLLMDRLCEYAVWTRNGCYLREARELVSELCGEYSELDEIVAGARSEVGRADAPRDEREAIEGQICDAILTHAACMCRDQTIGYRIDVIKSRLALADVVLGVSYDGVPPEVMDEYAAVLIDQADDAIRGLALIAQNTARDMAFDYLYDHPDRVADVRAYRRVAASDAFLDFEDNYGGWSEHVIQAHPWRQDLERRLLPLRERLMELDGQDPTCDVGARWELMCACACDRVTSVALDERGICAEPLVMVPTRAARLRDRVFAWECTPDAVRLVTPDERTLFEVSPRSGEVPDLTPMEVADAAHSLLVREDGFGSREDDAARLMDEVGARSCASPRMADGRLHALEGVRREPTQAGDQR